MSKPMDKPLAARILAEAFVTSVKAASTAHGVSSSVIYQWRSAAKDDAELAQFYAEALAACDGQWRRDLRAVASEACKTVVSLQRQLLEALADAAEAPDADPMQRVMMLSDAQASTLRVMQAAVETLVQYEALVVDTAPTPTLKAVS